MTFESPPWEDSDLPAFNGEDEFFQITDQIAERIALYGPLPWEDTQTNGHAPQAGVDVAETVTSEAPPEEQPEEQPMRSWTPIDLLTAAANPPDPPTISGIIYPGALHVFSGEPDAGKSWSLLVVMIEEMRKGQTVMYVDLEMGGRMMTERLQQLGATDDQIRHQFIYVEPTEALTAEGIMEPHLALIKERAPSLIAIDAFTGVLLLHGYNPDKSIDVEAFYQKIAGPLRQFGAAIVILDHLPKDKENRGKYVAGSERKITRADVHISFAIITPFGRGTTGRTGLHAKRDRGGWLRKPLTCEMILISDPVTGAVNFEWKEPEGDENPHAPFRPTKLMEKVSRFMETHPGSHTRKDIETGVTGVAKYIRAAIDCLVREEHISEESGPHRSRVNTLLKPYREDEEPSSSTSSRPRLDEQAVLVSSPPRGSLDPRDEDEVTAAPKNRYQGSSSSNGSQGPADSYYDTLFFDGDEEYDDGVDF